MTVSASGGLDASSLVRQLLASLQSNSSSTTTAGDAGPAKSAGSADSAEPAPGPPPGPPPAKPDGSSSDRFSADTLSSLLQAQEQPSASDVAVQLIGSADTDGSGALSLDEITKALSGDGSSTASTGASSSSDAAAQLKAAFAKLDTNGGQLSQDELTAGLQKLQSSHHGGHHHHHAAYAQAASSTADATATTATTATAANDASTASTVTATDLAA